jgi:biopolymer transport protein ExbB
MISDLRPWVTATLLAVSLMSAAPVRSGERFEEAYARELEILQLEKTALEKKLDGLETGADETLAALRGKVERLSAELTKVRIRNNDLEDSLARNREIVDAHQGGDAFIDSFTSMVKGTLSNLSVALPGGEAPPEQRIQEAFSNATQRIEALGRVRVEKGTFFDANGKERTSDILWISRVSATSLDKTHGGMLAPAAENAMRVVKPTDKRLRRYVEDNSESLVSVLLFDPLEKEEGGEVPTEKSLWQVFVSGGFVMWPILFLAIISVVILLDRFFVLRRIHTNADRLMGRVGTSIVKQSWDDAKRICERNAGAVAQVLTVILRNRTRPREQQEELVYETILAQKPKMERFLSLLNIVAAVAPLLGLLGTVTGMIGTFEMITVHGTGDPKMLSGGISEALLTTQFGLMVAIPALFFHAILSSRVDHVLGDMETNSLKLLNLLHCTGSDDVPVKTVVKEVSG